jgi:hypothetical protein
MDIWLTYGLATVLFLVLEVLWARPAGSGPAGRDDSASTFDDWDPAVLPFLRDRLDAVTEEMERLEDDDTVYARAFRYSVCRAVRQDLLADLAEVGARYRPTDGFRPRDVDDEPGVTEMELGPGSPDPRWEEIDV